MKAAIRKEIANYRETVSSVERCDACRYFVKGQAVAMGAGGRPKACGHKCRILGVKNRKDCAIDPAFICDFYRPAF